MIQFDKDMFTEMLMAIPASMLGASSIGILYGYDFSIGMFAGVIIGFVIAIIASMSRVNEERQGHDSKPHGGPKQQKQADYYV